MTIHVKSARDLVIANYIEQHRALIDEDWEALSALLTTGFTRTQLNGRTQTKDQWLAALQTGEIKYHSFEEVSIKAEVDGSSGKLLGRTIGDVTFYGERQRLSMALRQWFIKTGGQWLASRSVAAPW